MKTRSKAKGQRSKERRRQPKPLPLRGRFSFGLSPSTFGPGFTLVEVLATLTLAAIILPVAMKGISLATAAAGEARHQTEAATLAESTLTNLIATGDWQGSNLTGDYGEDWPDYRWTADVESWNGTVLQQITVHVLWDARGSEHEVTVSTLAYTGQDQ